MPRACLQHPKRIPHREMKRVERKVQGAERKDQAALEDCVQKGPGVTGE